MSKKTMDFNKDILELEQIIQTMEGEGLSLENALKNYEKGIKLVRQCQQVINNAEQKIIQLSKEDDYQGPNDKS